MLRPSRRKKLQNPPVPPPATKDAQLIATASPTNGQNLEDSILKATNTPGFHSTAEQAEDLWDRAYDHMCEDEKTKKLIANYERILLAELEDGIVSSDRPGCIESSQRTAQMSRLVEKKLKDIDDAKLKFRIGEKTVVCIV